MLAVAYFTLIFANLFHLELKNLTFIIQVRKNAILDT